MNENKDLVFCNEIIIGNLQFAKSKLSIEKYNELVSSLGVEDKWLFDKSAWHTAEFQNLFREKFEEYLPDIQNPAEAAAIYFFEKKGFKRFTSLISVLITPENLFKNLPKFVKTMNRYNTYKIVNITKQFLFTKISYQQYYINLNLKLFNNYLCDGAKGSIQSVCKYLGYKIFDLHESKCVKRGDEYCQYEITWIRHSFLPYAVAWFFLLIGTYVLLKYTQINVIAEFIITLLLPTAVISLISYFKIRKNLHEAFEYQQELLEEQKEKYTELNEISARIIEYQQQINEAISLSTLGAHSFNLIHEIATPVNIITYCTSEMVKDLQAGDSSKEKLLNLSFKAEKGSERILKMIKFFRTIVKGINPTTIALDIISTTKDCHELIYPMLHKNDVELTFNSELEKFTIETYDGYIETIILNILQNAVNALKAKEKDRKIYINIYPISPKENEVAIDEIILLIGNNGPAISDSFLKKIWQKFETNSTKETPGSGFGLYNVKKLIEKIGGEISVETGYNDGNDTRFLIKFKRELSKEIETEENINDTIINPN